MLAIIGGTGLTQLANLEISHRQVMRTPYGEPSGAITFGHLRQHEVMFIARHGYGHTIPPHEVNYRANLWALKEQGAQRIISVAAVGGIRADLLPGVLVLPDQIIDYTYGRQFTYFDGRDCPVTHIDFTQPYSQELRQQILNAGRCADIPCLDGGVYAATQGPRLDTAAEINRLERDGADMVGMTGMPEAALAKELGLNYAAIAVVVNHAAGRGSSHNGVHLETISAVVQPAMARVRNILECVVDSDVD
ncbi:S-methyl-5'-thioinosine phosphorylase [Candidatus Nitrotoga sp. HW29]|uniref:S-methyl-5'-thioinosine phosphorylase n=1 Tax=Candidatus Nitrotoga sp. HW29 TaxID=2886963 RepID=UPI001EF2F39C|nr:S-methyl-5'-thioinosine phosphorylase [Candidatus Nitrotoga sp. HW29]CAH1903401.1 S-methyl-5'-thioinosine phosphorylase [Candidatus Nitrotoga sp. HW29]